MKALSVCLSSVSLLVRLAAGESPTDRATLTRVLPIQAHDARSVVGSLAFSPDNRILASGGGTTDSIGSHGEIKLWNPSNGILIAELKGHGGLVDAIAFSPDGKFVAGGGYRLIVWDANKHKKVRTMKPGGLVHALAFSPDGKLLASACRGQPYAQIWEVETGRMQGKLFGGADNTRTVYSVDFSHDGALVALGGHNQPATLWGKATLALKTSFTNGANVLDSAEYVKFSPDDKLLFTKGDYSIAGRFWDVAKARVVVELQGDDDIVDDADFSPDGVFWQQREWIV